MQGGHPIASGGLQPCGLDRQASQVRYSRWKVCAEQVNRSSRGTQLVEQETAHTQCDRYPSEIDWSVLLALRVSQLHRQARRQAERQAVVSISARFEQPRMRAQEPADHPAR